jgi:hypothetical protein
MIDPDLSDVLRIERKERKDNFESKTYQSPVSSHSATPKQTTPSSLNNKSNLRSRYKQYLSSEKTRLFTSMKHELFLKKKHSQNQAQNNQNQVNTPSPLSTFNSDSSLSHLHTLHHSTFHHNNNIDNKPLYSSDYRIHHYLSDLFEYIPHLIRPDLNPHLIDRPFEELTSQQQRALHYLFDFQSIFALKTFPPSPLIYSSTLPSPSHVIDPYNRPSMPHSLAFPLHFSNQVPLTHKYAELVTSATLYPLLFRFSHHQSKDDLHSYHEHNTSNPNFQSSPSNPIFHHTNNEIDKTLHLPTPLPAYFKGFPLLFPFEKSLLLHRFFAYHCSRNASLLKLERERIRELKENFDACWATWVDQKVKTYREYLSTFYSNNTHLDGMNDMSTSSPSTANISSTSNPNSSSISSNILIPFSNASVPDSIPEVEEDEEGDNEEENLLASHSALFANENSTVFNFSPVEFSDVESDSDDDIDKEDMDDMRERNSISGNINNMRSQYSSVINPAFLFHLSR